MSLVVVCFSFISLLFVRCFLALFGGSLVVVVSFAVSFVVVVVYIAVTTAVVVLLLSLYRLLFDVLSV